MKHMNNIDHFACAALAILPRATDKDLEGEFYGDKVAVQTYKIARALEKHKRILDKS